MRIISGEHRSRKLKRPPSEICRPTKDRVREAIFSMIASRGIPAKVLDLFSGSAAFSLEAISRGAEEAYAVESDPVCLQIIKENISALGVDSRVRVIRRDVFFVLSELASQDKSFGLVFADPPYGLGICRKTLNMVYQYDILIPTGILVMEHSSEEYCPERVGDINLLKQKTYNDTLVSLYRRDE